MKKFLSVFVLLSALILPVIAQEEEVTETYKKEAMALYPFRDDSNRWKDEGNKITEIVESILINMKRFKIVDRQNLDKALKEMELQLTGITEQQIVQMGKVQGYNKAITGSILEIKTMRDDEGKTPTMKAVVRILVKGIQIETTEVFFSKEIEGEGSAEIKKGGNEAAKDAALKEAYRKFANELVMQMRNQFKIKVKVNNVKAGKVQLLVGSETGVQQNWKFKILGEGESIVDPDGKVLEKIQNQKATVKIDKIGKSYALANVVRGGDVKKGDIAEELVMSGVKLGLMITFDQFKVTPNQSSNFYYRYNTTDYPLTLQVTSNEYTPGIFLRGYYTGTGIFQPGFDIGILPGNFSMIAAEFRFVPGFNFDILGEVIQFSIEPFVGVAGCYASLGKVEAPLGMFYLNSDGIKYIPNGKPIWLAGYTLGAGISAQIRVTFSDYFGVSLGAGYKYYLPITQDTFNSWFAMSENSDGESVDLGKFPADSKLPTANLSGVSFQFALEGYF
ncbi:MAG: hypothetical protein HZC28_05040 [Spirochaetes bacterium]|nr:hypothetical protein [Spirochaetota bacterium]